MRRNLVDAHREMRGQREWCLCTRASDMLGRGMAHGFQHAMYLVQTMCVQEVAVSDPNEPDKGMIALENEINRCLQILSLAAQACLYDYHESGQNRPWCLHKWAQSPSPDVRSIGRCFEARDYRALAI